MPTEPQPERSKRPAVLVIIQNLPLAVDRRVRLECQALLRAGYQVSVICPRGTESEGYHVADGIHVYSYRPTPGTKGLLSYLVEFVYCWVRAAVLSGRVLRERGFDVIQACNPPDTYWLLALLYRPLGKKFVYDQHDLNPEVYRSRFGRDSGLLLKGLVLLERMSYAAAHHVVSTNESYKLKALTRGHRKPEDVTVVRSGPDPRRMTRGAEVPELRQEREHLAVYLGIMGPQDGVDYLVRSIAHFVHDLGHTSCTFAILGFGDALPSLKALATELRLDDYIVFTGRADEAMINAYLSTASVGLSPDPLSPLNDVSTMNKTLEYMAFELPVVAFDLAETRISAGPAALYVEDNDELAYAKALAELLQDPARRRTMGETGRHRIEAALAWPHQEPAYVGVFDRLTSHRRTFSLPDNTTIVLPGTSAASTSVPTTGNDLSELASAGPNGTSRG